jgi:hypothetical protein
MALGRPLSPLTLFPAEQHRGGSPSAGCTGHLRRDELLDEPRPDRPNPQTLVWTKSADQILDSELRTLVRFVHIEEKFYLVLGKALQSCQHLFCGQFFMDESIGDIVSAGSSGLTLVDLDS